MTSFRHSTTIYPHTCAPSQSPPWWQKVADIIFTAMFTLEMSLKLAALGLRYFMDAWNWLDAIVVIEVLLLE